MTLDLDVEGAGTCDAPPAWGQFGFPQVAPAQEIVLECLMLQITLLII